MSPSSETHYCPSPLNLHLSGMYLPGAAIRFTRTAFIKHLGACPPFQSASGSSVLDSAPREASSTVETTYTEG